MLKITPFSSSVAFLTPPTFPAPAPQKRFFSPLPTKILGLLNPQRTTAAPPVPRAGAFRISRGPARRGIFAGAGVWYLLRPAGWRRWRMAGRSGGGWLALRLCACAAWYLLRGPARLVSPAPARLAALADGWPSCRLPELSAVLPTVCPPCRPPPPSEPPTPTACRRWRVCRLDHLPRRSADPPPGRPEPPPRVFTAPGIVPG